MSDFLHWMRVNDGTVFRRRMLRARNTVLAMAVCVLMNGALSGSVHAMDGFYMGGAFGQENIDADYTKTVLLEVPVSASDDAQDRINAFKVFLGYRQPLPNRFYVAGEIEASVYSDAKVTGFLEGTGLGSNDVWPGGWEFEKHHGVGLNVKAGYRPEGYLDSVYLVSGFQWIDASVLGRFESPIATGTIHSERNAIPWFVGGGVELGSGENRLDIRVQYAMYAIEVPHSGAVDLNHEFDFVEMGVYLGYVRFFEFASIL